MNEEVEKLELKPVSTKPLFSPEVSRRDHLAGLILQTFLLKKNHVIIVQGEAVSNFEGAVIAADNLIFELDKE